MNDEDIRQFLQSFSDFMKHSDTEIQKHEEYLKAKEYTTSLLEKKAAELEVTVDYYMQELSMNQKGTNHSSTDAD
jgi:hypothetical protein